MSSAARLTFGFLILLLVLLPALAPVLAQPDSPEPAPLFASDELLELRLEGDLRPILRDRSEEAPYRPAVLTYAEAESDSIPLEIGVKTRGNFRLHQLRCDVPPLRFDFRDAKRKGTVFAGQGKVKLVTHCENGSESFEQRALREYLIYRLYNLFTPYSFQVRLVRITYVDTERNDDAVTRFGFLLEDDDDVAERNNGKIVSGITVHPEVTEQALQAQLDLFQFMVGNTDWAVSKQHNIELVYVGDTGPMVAVPYDFDWAGFVDSPYATPDPSVGTDHVRERVYRGFCRDEAEYAAAIARFNEKREEVMALVRDFPYLEPKYAEDPVEYLEEFYELINDQKRVRREIVRSCRKIG